MKLEYLIFDLLILTISTAGPVVMPAGRWPHLKPAAVAIALIGLPYLVWDHIVTNWWWSFNPQYILGWKLGVLPLEEILFFMVVPWGCLVIWENLKTRINGSVSSFWSWLLMSLGIVLAVVSFTQAWWYTWTVMVLTSAVVLADLQTSRWLQQKAAMVFLAMVVGLTLIFNGYLTARPVVEYNPQIMSSLRLGTVPIEDVHYGLILVGAVAVVYEKFSKGRAV